MTVVFAGPSVTRAEVRARLGDDALVLPPAAAGDVLRAARRRPRAIALIDGVFERAPAVWHKELLWAMAQGIHVFGAASMGALRAAELHAFGMRGVGRVFEGYRDGAIEADDEVAILHGPEEVGFVAVSEALVNVRATLARAAAEGVLDVPAADGLLALARAVHYRERTWGAILARSGAWADAAGRLERWLPAGRVDAKRADALELLDAVAAFLAETPSAAPPAGFAFAWTDAWDELHARSVADAAEAEPILDELRLLGPDRLAAVRRAALLRLVARREAERAGVAPEPAAVRAAKEGLRARLGLWRRDDLDRWLRAADLDVAGLEILAEDEALLARLARDAGPALAVHVLAELRAGGGYAALAARAREKRARLAAAGLDDVDAAAALGVDTSALLAQLAGGAGDGCEGSPAEQARTLGFADSASLERALLRERLFVGIIEANDGRAAQARPPAQPAGPEQAERDRWHE